MDVASMNSVPERHLERINDPLRLAALNASALLDSAPEACFDRFTRLISDILQTPVSLISLIDKDRQFFKSQIGLSDPWKTRSQTPLSHSFCQYVVSIKAPLVVSDARIDNIFKDNLATHELGVVAYLGIPLTTLDDHTLGALCAIDSKPRHWSDRDIAIVNDLAAIVMTEIELRLLARSYREKYKQLKTLEAERDSMVHMLVHDLRNPLTSLIAGVELMTLETQLTPLQQSIFDATLRGGQHLMRMINDILDVSKAHASRLEIKRSTVDFNQLLLDTYAEVKPLASRQQITLSCSPAEGLNKISIDPDKLYRVLINLISNAIQHTPREGKVDIRCTVKTKDQLLEIAISDNGCGISKEDQTMIFERFWSGSTQTDTKRSSGLGLAFCKLACEAHGGKISVSSQLGRGSTFTVTLPILH